MIIKKIKCDNVTVEKQSNKEFNINLDNNSDVKDDNVILRSINFYKFFLFF